MSNSENSNNNLFKEFLEDVDVNSCISNFNSNNENKIFLSISSMLEIINNESRMLDLTKHCIQRKHFKNFSNVFTNGFIPVTLDELTLTAFKNFQIFYLKKKTVIEDIIEKENINYHILVNNNKQILSLFNNLNLKNNSKKYNNLIIISQIKEKIDTFKNNIYDLLYLFEELMIINIEMKEVKSILQIKNNFENFYNNLLSIKVIPFLKQTLLLYMINGDSTDYISEYPMQNVIIKTKNEKILKIISKRFYDKKSYRYFQKLVITNGIEEVLKRTISKKNNEILKSGGSNKEIDSNKINEIVKKEVYLNSSKEDINYIELYNNDNMEQLKIIITKRIKKTDNIDNSSDVDNADNADNDENTDNAINRRK
ncbi:hypothetical protein PIROE2DRAFT_14427 [Piromyces sp. E2]|nr:hypothetical protein PIROE2DRAFT_14427 [Piromyces sp. E2]|eukprot:OUM59905.1 hypothetical protein PIROE2DRAFT_14427 [Piromyces sp. E2]